MTASCALERRNCPHKRFRAFTCSSSWTGTACRAWADGLISSRKPRNAMNGIATRTSSHRATASSLKREENDMRKLNTSLLAGLAVTSLIYAGAVGADDERHRVKATLSGFQETPSTLSSPGSGRFTAKIDDDAQTIDYRLSYEGLEAPAIAAHIHLGARGTSGGGSAFLCRGGNNPACPPRGGPATGSLTPADIIGPAAQGIAPGEFAEVVRAIRNGAVYANVHSTLRPGGEIRGQLRADKEDD